jgi:hypothetical protein
MVGGINAQRGPDSHAVISIRLQLEVKSKDEITVLLIRENMSALLAHQDALPARFDNVSLRIPLPSAERLAVKKTNEVVLRALGVEYRGTDHHERERESNQAHRVSLLGSWVTVLQ